MRFIHTRCPRCGSRFYRKLDDGKGEKRKDGIEDIECPGCGYLFTDAVEDDRVKEVDFYWELDEDIYPPVKGELGRWDILKPAGILLFLTLPFLLYPLIDTMWGTSNFFSYGSPELLGVFAGEFVLAGLITIAALSCLKYYSFPVAIAGPVIVFLNIGLFGIFSTDLVYSPPLIQWHWILIGPGIMAFFSLVAIVQNRKRFQVF